MSQHSTRRAVGVAAAASLGIVGLVSASGSSPASADGSTTPVAEISPSEFYINYAEPRVGAEFGTDIEVIPGRTSTPSYKSVLEEAAEFDRKHAGGNPVTASALARVEAEAIATGKNPKSIMNRYKSAGATQEARLLTLLVEFNDEANDDFTGVQVPEFFGADTCALGTVQNGPLHNNIPDPATGSFADNNSMWVPDFSPEHFNQMLYTSEGLTERVRTDLTGPDGQPGFDLSGYTMKNMYEEMSHGAYTVTGSATPWIEVPHSEGWYGASVCHLNDDGVYEPGAIQDMQGHPDNPLGPQQLAIDAVEQLVAQYPDFPLEDYDIEDQADRDGDGNFYEPDGVIDHVVLVHAGADKSGGGGAEGTYAIWAHSSAVPGGHPIADTGLALSNYIVQPEDSGVGVFAHEYGHDLGLPDLYDTSGGGDSDVDFWDLMASGSHSGPIFQSIPTHMGLWDKWVLGWADPVEINPGDDPRAVKVGQNSRPLKGAADGVKINLPDKVVTLATPHSGANMWYTGADQDWADIRLSRTVDVPSAADARFWMWNNYVIEEDWDFGFVEVSTDGGATWEEQKVFDEAGALVSTDDGYPDPNGRMADYGGKKYGLHGSSGGWRHDYVDLTPYAGTTIDVRLRLATDAAFLERGWFADDFSLTADGATVWSDDVESGNNGWTNEVDTFVDTTGPGWRIDSGTSVNSQYYLVEWRNFDGFDEGLRYAYDSTYLLDDGSWKVEKIAYNAPGALVWYRDTSYGNANHVTSDLFGLPSIGAKGGLLIVDSHFDPLRRTGAAAAADPSVLNNMPSRPQSSNAAFGLQPTYPFTECITGATPAEELCTDIGSQPPVSTFTDDLGWYPGIEVVLGQPDPADDGFYFRDADASVVVPSVGVQPYTTRIVYSDGSPATDFYGLNFGSITGTGNPGDSGVGYGTVVEVTKTFDDDRAAQIKITPPDAG